MHQPQQPRRPAPSSTTTHGGTSSGVYGSGRGTVNANGSSSSVGVGGGAAGLRRTSGTPPPTNPISASNSRSNVAVGGSLSHSHRPPPAVVRKNSSTSSLLSASSASNNFNSSAPAVPANPSSSSRVASVTSIYNNGVRVGSGSRARSSSLLSNKNKEQSTGVSSKTAGGGSGVDSSCSGELESTTQMIGGGSGGSSSGSTGAQQAQRRVSNDATATQTATSSSTTAEKKPAASTSDLPVAHPPSSDTGATSLSRRQSSQQEGSAAVLGGRSTSSSSSIFARRLQDGLSAGGGGTPATPSGGISSSASGAGLSGGDDDDGGEDGGSSSRTGKGTTVETIGGATTLSSVAALSPSTCVVDCVRGFSNLGNTCFMNSTMQVVLRCPRLRHFLLTADISGLFGGGRFQRDTPLTQALQDVALKMFVPPASATSASTSNNTVTLTRNSSAILGGPIAPSHFKQCFSTYKRAFAGFQQHDAQEFLRFALDVVNDECNRIPRKPKYEEIKDAAEGEAVATAAARWMKSHRRVNDSIVQDEFCGQFATQTQCQSCNHVSVSCEPFLDISVSIGKKHADSQQVKLEDCLEDYFSESTLTSAEHGYKCEKCKCKNGVAKRRTAVFSCPDVLVVHIKRFRHHRMMLTKVNDIVKFPVDNELSLEPFLNPESSFSPTTTNKASTSSSSQQQQFAPSRPLYRLLGVVNHMGSAHSGHYTSYVRCFNVNNPSSSANKLSGGHSTSSSVPTTGGKHAHHHQRAHSSWYEFNDSTVSSLGAGGSNEVVSSAAYLLFYERVAAAPSSSSASAGDPTVHRPLRAAPNKL